MIKDGLTYNPAFHYSDSISWFRSFIMVQDQVPDSVFNTAHNQLETESRIVQVRIVRPKKLEKSLFTSHQLPPASFETKAKVNTNPGWFSPVLIFCFILLAVAQYSWPKRMAQVFKAFFVGRLFIQLTREGGLFNERLSIMLFSVYMISLAGFIFQITEFYLGVPSDTYYGLLLFMQLLAGVIAFYVIKIALFRFTGTVFKSAKETSDYTSTIFVFGQIAGLLILPFLVLVTYLKSETFIVAGLVLWAMLYIYRLYRGAVTVTSSSKISAYYLFLYLCTLEILPLIIIAKGIIELNA